jgi:hypothetical protein
MQLPTRQMIGPSAAKYFYQGSKLAKALISGHEVGDRKQSVFS